MELKKLDWDLIPDDEEMLARTDMLFREEDNDWIMILYSTEY